MFPSQAKNTTEKPDGWPLRLVRFCGGFVIGLWGWVLVLSLIFIPLGVYEIYLAGPWNIVTGIFLVLALATGLNFSIFRQEASDSRSRNAMIWRGLSLLLRFCGGGLLAALGLVGLHFGLFVPLQIDWLPGSLMLWMAWAGVIGGVAGVGLPLGRK